MMIFSRGIVEDKKLRNGNNQIKLVFSIKIRKPAVKNKTVNVVAKLITIFYFFFFFFKYMRILIFLSKS